MNGIPVEQRPTLRLGDSGRDVVDLQRMLPRYDGAIDGDFGSITEDAVLEYQRSRGLDVDGIVGQQTWAALYANKRPVRPAVPPQILTGVEQETIKQIADDSMIADYDWEDRGLAPTGYTQGMALAFATTYKKFKVGHPAVIEMAKARTNSDKDALNLYRDEFVSLGMSNEVSGIDTLRHLYVMMLGSGMRESSGRHCEGRDMSADNVTAETCEAGLFQTSYNAHSASDPDFTNLMDEYSSPFYASTCFLDAFAEDVKCSESEWSNYGDGLGAQFQELCKVCPAFAVETHALTLRNLCNHYGPCIRMEIELRYEAELMFRRVQDFIDESEIGT